MEQRSYPHIFVFLVMTFSLVNGRRTLAAKGLRGVCPACGSPTRAHCGSVYVHHWKHINTDDCDTWYEPISKWHIDWQNHFPVEWQENVIRKESIFHRADVLTSTGVVLEFQNSSIGLDEAIEREKFYGKMIWILNGACFKENFHIAMEMPHDWMEEFDVNAVYPRLRPYFVRAKYSSTGNPRIKRAEEFFLERYAGKPTVKNKVVYFWNHPRKTWFECSMPVFIDFGDEVIWRLGPKYTLTKYTKNEFIQKYNPMSADRTKNPNLGLFGII